MATETFNFWYLILQLLLWLATLGMLGIFYDQLRASRAAATGQNILALVNFLQDPYVREARTIVRGKLKDKASYMDWTREDKHAADIVCSTYDVAAILIFQERLVPAKPFVENWGASIRDCFEVLGPHIQEMQKHSGSAYWDDFLRLYYAAKGKTATRT
jgi:hypothetical protein